MSRLIVFLDHNSNYLDRVEKMINDTNRVIKYYYLEDFLTDSKKDILESDIIYFLTNDSRVLDIINLLPNNRILNKEYYINKYSKMDIQFKLKNNGVLVPDLIDKDEFINNDFPLYIKNKSHDTMVLKCCSKNTFYNFFKKFNREDFYLEKELKSVDIVKEYKVYYANKNIFISDKENVSDEISCVSNKISSVLGMDVYSADLIKTKDAIYVVDVNSAPGFWNSKDSRLALISYTN